MLSCGWCRPLFHCTGRGRGRGRGRPCQGDHISSVAPLEECGSVSSLWSLALVTRLRRDAACDEVELFATVSLVYRLSDCLISRVVHGFNFIMAQWVSKSLGITNSQEVSSPAPCVSYSVRVTRPSQHSPYLH